MTIDLNPILKLLLPAFLIDNFEIIKIEEKDLIICIFLQENNDLAVEYEQSKFISHGFHKEIIIKDFPIRGKQVNLHVKRRRWLNKETKQVDSKRWDLVAEGTRMTKEFATFLKAIN